MITFIILSTLALCFNIIGIVFKVIGKIFGVIFGGLGFIVIGIVGLAICGFGFIIPIAAIVLLCNFVIKACAKSGTVGANA